MDSLDIGVMILQIEQGKHLPEPHILAKTPLTQFIEKAPMSASAASPMASVDAGGFAAPENYSATSMKSRGSTTTVGGGESNTGMATPGCGPTVQPTVATHGPL